MNSLDTNLVLRYLVGDVPDQAIRARLVIEAEPCYVTDAVITETVFVLESYYELTRQRIASFLRRFLTLPNIQYNADYIDGTINLYESQAALSIVDSYAATEARVYQNVLLTFDKKLQQYGGSHVLKP